MAAGQVSIVLWYLLDDRRGFVLPSPEVGGRFYFPHTHTHTQTNWGIFYSINLDLERFIKCEIYALVRVSHYDVLSWELIEKSSGNQ